MPNAKPKANSGDLIIEGYANTWVQDRDFEVILRTAFDATIEPFLRKNPILLWQHNHDWPFGQFADLFTDETGLACVAYVRQPQPGEEAWRIGAYNDVRAGIVRTLSIGGWFTREIIDNQIAVTNVDLFEISVVSVPSNPDSIFEAAVKSIKGARSKSFLSDRMVSQAAQLLGMEPLTDPILIRMSATDMQAYYANLSAQYQRTQGLGLPPMNTWAMLNARIGAPDADVTTLAAAVEEIVGRVYYDHTKSIAFANLAKTQKAGRALSKANEDKLRSVADSLASILDGSKTDALARAVRLAKEQAAADAGGRAEALAQAISTALRPGAIGRLTAQGKRKVEGDASARSEAVEAAITSGLGLTEFGQEVREARAAILAINDAPVANISNAVAAALKKLQPVLARLDEQKKLKGVITGLLEDSTAVALESFDQIDTAAAAQEDRLSHVPETVSGNTGVTNAVDQVEAALQAFDEDLAATRTAINEAQTSLAAVLSSVDAENEDEGKSERHCPKCGTYMDWKEGAKCPNCGYILHLSADDGDEKKALPVASLPFASRDRAWDSGAAKNRVHAWAKKDDGTYDPAKLKQAYLWLDNDGDANKVTPYRFIVADIIGGKLTYVPRGVFAAANVLQGGRGGTTIGDAGVAALKRSVEKLYARMRSEFNDDGITVPWAD
jgi:HK97 family phage prohead protease